MPIGAIFALLAFAGVFLLFVGLNQARRSAGGAEDFQARLAAYGVTTAGASQLPPASGFRDTLNRIFSPAAERVGRGDAKKGKPSVAEQLGRADLKLRTSEYFMIQLGSTALFMLIGLLRFGFPGGIIQIVALGILGYLVPGMYVKFRIGRRLRAFNGQLGDTLTLLSNALKAGYSFAQAIDTVAKNAVPPIADEFARAVREMNLGGSPDEALSNITKRIASADFDLVATAYSIHRTVGGNLAEILDNISYTIRERVRIKGEIATLTAQGQITAWVISLLPIGLALLLYVLNGSYMQNFFGPPIVFGLPICGLAMLATALIMISVGFAIVQKIVDIEI